MMSVEELYARRRAIFEQQKQDGEGEAEGEAEAEAEAEEEAGVEAGEEDDDEDGAEDADEEVVDEEELVEEDEEDEDEEGEEERRQQAALGVGDTGSEIDSDDSSSGSALDAEEAGEDGGSDEHWEHQPDSGIDAQGGRTVTRSRCKKAPYWLTDGAPRRWVFPFLPTWRCATPPPTHPLCIDEIERAEQLPGALSSSCSAAELDTMDEAGQGSYAMGTTNYRTDDIEAMCRATFGEEQLEARRVALKHKQDKRMQDAGSPTGSSSPMGGGGGGGDGSPRGGGFGCGIGIGMPKRHRPLPPDRLGAVAKRRRVAAAAAAELDHQSDASASPAASWAAARAHRKVVVRPARLHAFARASERDEAAVQVRLRLRESQHLPAIPPCLERSMLLPLLLLLLFACLAVAGLDRVVLLRWMLPICATAGQGICAKYDAGHWGAAAPSFRAIH
eukprot:SAG22_NODE_1208_length_5164_cov_10.104442_2_plen_446_part_00